MELLDYGLLDYADKYERGRVRRRRCLTCALDDDILKQIVEGREQTPKPVSFPTISRWLEGAHNVKIQPNTIRNHFVAGHHHD